MAYCCSLINLSRKVLLVAAFGGLCLLVTPSIGLFLSHREVLCSENRRLHSFPILKTWRDLAGFPLGFERYFDDRFYLRERLTGLHHRLLIRWFHRSPEKKVVLAKNGWLFLNGTQGNFVDLCHRNVQPFSAAEVEAIHAEMRKRRDWIASWGGKTVFVIVPEKETIYPEHLSKIYQSKVNPVSRYDQWKKICDTDPALTCVDLRPALLAAKAKGLIYYRSDSHWNFDGAYVGYSELLKPIHKWFPNVIRSPKPMILGHATYRGDLAKLLAVGDWFDEQDQNNYGNPSRSCAKRVAALSGDLEIPLKSEPIVYECKNVKLPNAVLVRDSMANRWRPLLPDNFKRTVLMFNWFPSAEVIEREHPDVVIFENVERTIEQLLYVTLDTGQRPGQARFSWPQK